MPHIADIGTFDEFKEIAEDTGYTGHKYRVEWTIGGMTGGDCWGGSADEAVSTESEPEDDALDVLLGEVSPDLTFLEYRRLIRACLYTYDERTSYEYYGNYYEYRSRTMDLEVLYRTLRDIYGDRK